MNKLCEFSGDDGKGSGIFVAAMSPRRFKYPLRAVRLKDINIRTKKTKTDNLGAIKEVSV